MPISFFLPENDHRWGILVWYDIRNCDICATAISGGPGTVQVLARDVTVRGWETFAASEFTEETSLADLKSIGRGVSSGGEIGG